MNVRSAFLSSVLASLLVACGGSLETAEPGDGGGGDTSVTDSGRSDVAPTDTTPLPDVVVDTIPIEDGGPGPDTGPKKGCPTAIPREGEPCAPVGLVCGFGEDPRPHCRQITTCKAKGWEVPVGACPPPPTAICPTSLIEAKDKTCTPVGAFCNYGDVQCGCGDCFGGPCGGTPRWVCPDPPTDTACPRKLPNLGVPCVKETTRCSYGSCSAGNIAGRVCTGGVWVDEPQACPL